MQDGMFVFNTSGSSYAYGNWIAAGAPQYNANGSNADIFTAIPGLNIIQVFQGYPGGYFDFNSIGLASVTNDHTGGDVAFTFYHHDGTIDTTTVTIKPGQTGLQTFNFDEHDVNLVEFLALSTQGNLLQFDNIGISLPTSAVPGPIVGAGLPGILFAGGGLLAWWRRKRRLNLANAS